MIRARYPDQWRSGATIRDVSMIISMPARDKAAERAKLEQMLRRLGATFLATRLIHDLSQPLTAINTWSSACLRLTKETPEMRPDLAERLSFLATEARRATDIIREFRAIVHRQLPDLIDVDVNAVLSNVADLLQEEAEAAGAAILVSAEKRLPPVLADADLLALAVFILCRNSLDALKLSDCARKEVHIMSRAMPDSCIRVLVRDTGPGLDAESVGTVFEPLLSTKPNGAGIGLAVCRALLEGLGGRLWLEANTRNGAAFAFDLNSALDGEEDDVGGGGIDEASLVRGG
jgi:signal transduction histidine kinase